MPKSANELFSTPRIIRRDIGDGACVLASKVKLEAYPDHVCDYLDRWARLAPDRTFLAERSADGDWAELSYSDVRSKARSIAAALLARGLGADDPVVILSDNGLHNGLLQLGCMYAGVPVAPVSPAYSLMSEDFAKLRHIGQLLEPKLVFATDGKLFENAFAALGAPSAEFVVTRNPPTGRTAISFDALTDASDETVDAVYRSCGPDMTAKILFTSGSTGMPKGVINTHRMLCSNQQAISQLWPFLAESPPVIVDWLPWNHTFGANHNFNMIMANGGTLYIDAGKPVPGLIEKTIANLKDIAPTIYFNVPRGYDMLIPQLEADSDFRDHFFSRLDLIFYAAAALPQSSWQRLEKLSREATGTAVVMTSAWGSTETAPLATSAHFPLQSAGNIGVPAVGTEVKLLPNGDKLEIRVRGPNVSPGYYKRPDLTDKSFDEDGFYAIGDATRLADESDPAKGLLFDGRVAEDFKLDTGTWVNVGALRLAAIAAGAPIIQDAVVTGQDRNAVGLLIFPSPAGCASVAGADSATPLAELIQNATVRSRLVEGLRVYNKTAGGTSMRIARVLLMAEPPNIDANEITDKGYINQRAVLTRRDDLVTNLYEGIETDDVIVLE